MLSKELPREDYTHPKPPRKHPCFPPWSGEDSAGVHGKTGILNRLVHWTWTGVHPACADLVYDANVEVGADMNLAREADVWSEFGFHRQAITFKVTHGPRITFE